MVGDTEVTFEEAALVTREAMLPSGIPGATSWEIVLRNAVVPLSGEVGVVIELAGRRVRGVARVGSDDRQAGGDFLLRTTVLAGLGALSDETST